MQYRTLEPWNNAPSGPMFSSSLSEQLMSRQT